MTNTLVGEFNAQKWVDEWLKTIEKYPSIPKDGDTMLGWFANAIMAGYDRAKGDIEDSQESEE